MKSLLLTLLLLSIPVITSADLTPGFKPGEVGTIHVTASADGLKAAETMIEAKN